MTKDYEQFYATPSWLADKAVRMLSRSHARGDGFILEPSAGDGALVKAYKKLNDSYNYPANMCQCIEINPQRAKILRDSGWRVVWDDFMTFDPLTPYCVILMNPPFHEGSRHLLKALSLCQPGGEIVCILNAETIKNPYNMERQQLLKELDNQKSWTVEYIEGAFKPATDVEVALIHVKMKETEFSSTLLDNFKKSFVEERNQEYKQQSLIRGTEIEQLIDLHHAEVCAGLALLDEINAYNAVALKEEEHDRGIFDIKIHTVGYTNSGESYYGCDTSSRSGLVKAVNYKYWKMLFRSKEISKLITSEAYKSYQHLLVKMADCDFNEYNILQLKEDLKRNLFDNLELAILKVFDEFTQKFSYYDFSENVHYYNGWKTNKAAYVNKKVIIPLYAFESYTFKKSSFNTSKVRREIEDIERVFNFLDGGRTGEELDLYEQLEAAQKKEQFRNVDTKYFLIDFFKKGTVHLKFKDMELLKKFNIYVGRQKQWLPPGYGYKSYDEMDKEEKDVVDSFEGKEEYAKTYNKRDYYLGSGNFLMLNSGN